MKAFSSLWESQYSSFEVPHDPNRHIIFSSGALSDSTFQRLIIDQELVESLSEIMMCSSVLTQAVLVVPFLKEGLEHLRVSVSCCLTQVVPI